MELLPRHDAVLERDWSLGLDDHIGRSAHRAQPRAELLGVRHRRRERGNLHVLREVDQNLFPDSAAVGVLEVVNLVHDNEREAAQGR
jgi:hypothetical protein